MHDFSGKHIVVAGASGGINLDIARSFARAGSALTLLSRSEEKIAAAAKTIRDAGGAATGHSCDVRDYAGLEKAFRASASEYGGFDVVVSGAAGNFLAPAIGVSANAFKTIVDIDLLGTFNVFRASWDHLVKPGASLIAITAGKAIHPASFQIHTCAAKAGVNMVIKCLALEWGPAGVRVNGISPGPIADTEGIRRLADPERAQAIKSRLALRDYGEKADVSSAARFLASSDARYITGAILNVDGGNDLGDASADALTLAAR